ncbi:DMT family transporter [Sandarakinorhabdus sp.]|uniref:DMT family transporter n=1 Tax=Sandarakinorhabdus sp. TaxID=1916663 RepID=UPI00286E0D57|nr:DMT family transporter [Sandarakinorhabdus sp.]
MTAPPANTQAVHQGRYAFAAMVAGSVCLAFGPWLVRLADVAPVASAWWRMLLAVPALLLLAGFGQGPGLGATNRALCGLAALAGLFFAADLAVWHLGIMRTTLANATLLANGATFLLPLYGLVVLRQKPGPASLLALALAAAGMALLVGRSADVSPRHLTGDLLCLAAAVFYTGYLIVMDRLRRSMAPMPSLALATLFGAAVLLPMALLEPGAFWPQDWTPVLGLAIGSQVIGQGLIVYAVRHLSALVVGLTLLVQPAISATIGALRFAEMPGPHELAGAALVVAALVLARLPGPKTPNS